MLSTTSMVAQGMFDYYGLTTPSFNGTARYMGMGGSFGALGGEVSSIADNPAALGLFRSNELNFTLNLIPTITSSSWDEFKIKCNDIDLNINNVAWVLNFPSYRQTGFLGSNVSFSYNRIKKIERIGELKNSNSPYSLTSLIAEMTNGLTETDLKYVEGSYDPYNNANVGYLSVLGYDGWLIDPVTTGSDQWQPAFSGTLSSNYHFAQKGFVDEYTFNYAGNVNDRIYFGLGLSLQNYFLDTESHYIENFSDGNSFRLNNSVEVEGSGFNFDLGLIARLSNAVRIGASFTSPTWYAFSKVQTAKLYTSKITNYTEPPIFEWTYKYSSPMRAQLSIGFIIKQKSAINIDYIFMANKTQRISGYKDNLIDKEFRIESDNMNKYSLNTHTIRIGAETRVAKGVKIRSGFGYITSPMRDDTQQDFALNSTMTTMEYMVDKAQFYGSCGIGFQLDNVFFDIAYAYHHQPQKFVPFVTSDSSFGSVFTSHQHNILATLVVKY